MRDLLAFTLPSMGIWLANPLLSLVDTSIVGLSSAASGSLLDLAALTPAVALSNNATHACGFLAVATTALVAQARARGGPSATAEAQQAVSDALCFALLVGVLLLGLLASSAVPLMAAMAGQASAELVPRAALYTQIRALGFPAAMLMMVAQAACLACKDPGPPLRAVILACAVNLAGDALLCLGCGMGVAGAAWATVAAQVGAAALLLSRLLRPGVLGSQPLLPALPRRLPSLAAAGRFARLGGPVAGVILTKVAYFTAVTRAATALSPTAAAAHGIMIAFFIVLGVLGDAVSQAAQSFLPGVLGRPPAAWVVARQLMTLGCCVGCFNVLAVTVTTLFGSHLFTTSPAVASAMRDILGVATCALLLHNCSMATAGMLLASGDLTFLLRANALGAIIALAAAAAATSAGFGLPGVWLAVLVFQCTRLGQNGARLLSARSPLRRTAPEAL